MKLGKPEVRTNREITRREYWATKHAAAGYLNRRSRVGCRSDGSLVFYDGNCVPLYFPDQIKKNIVEAFTRFWVI